MQTQYRKVKKYLELINSTRYGRRAAIEGITYCNCDYKESNTPPSPEAFVPYAPGMPFGQGNDSHAWFHFTVNVPPEMKGQPINLNVATERRGWDADNPQFICYIDGEMRQGLDMNHTYVRLGDKDSYDVYLYAYTGPRVPQARLVADLVVVNETTDQLYFDIVVPFEMLTYMNETDREYAEILAHLDRAVSMLDLFNIGSAEYFASVAAAKAYMDEEFYGKYCFEQPETTICIGHTHIDCAWKWTLKQTREKVQRSFATVLELMRRYPEYIFMSSQALLYQNLKEEAPELYEQVKAMIKAGRWECEGAMWVEADCNLTSGESLVRQVMYGKNFFREEFGLDNRVLWLPDVFGYSAALPQILRKAGVEWFVTSKISWNESNTMPYDTFAWYGIDGTPINSFFLTPQDKHRGQGPVRHTTYVGNTRPAMIAGTYDRYQQKNLNNEALLTFGYGDGGGGPTPEHLEYARRTAHGIPGAPNAKIEKAGDFLARLEKKIEGNKLLPKWRGELYLEFHRGTYTSIAKNKRANRKSEFLYAAAEQSASMAKALTGRAFPKSELHRGWESILTNQFHDIIPGSSIREVYDQSDIDYAEIARIGQGVVDASYAEIASRVDKKEGYVVFNPNSFVGEGLVSFNGTTAYVENIPPLGYRVVSAEELSTDCGVVIDGHTVETDCLKVTFDAYWQISSMIDLASGREIIRAGEVGNEFRIYADYPDVYDAWEWQPYSNEGYRTITEVASVETVRDGARVGIKITRPYQNSMITQTVWFTDGTPRVEFETTADWHERHKMLKVAFPTTINADKATYEIQFGNLERPTHTNTSWDKAKFEVCAQKYADLSDGGFGLSILNDCKYGHDIHDGTIQLSLIKCATDPYEDADQGAHAFTYALYPHAGTFVASDTVKEAYDLNAPMIVLPAAGEATTLPLAFSAVSSDRDNVICETIKEAEYSDATILRLYECKNMVSPTTLTLGLPASHCYVCDLMEHELYELPIENGQVKLNVGGFEIVTLKLV